MRILLSTCCAFTLLSLSPAQAEDQVAALWHMDKDNSTINFTAKQMGAEVEGTFEKFNATIYFSPDMLDKSHVTVNIDINSVNSEYEKRDKTLVGDQWFDTAKYPEGVFTCKDFTLKSGTAEKGHYSCAGTLTLRDVTKKIELPFDLSLQNTADKSTAKMTSTLTLKRLDYNLGQGDWADSSIIGDEVLLNIQLHATTTK